jgi:hypothetical protein
MVLKLEMALNCSLLEAGKVSEATTTRWHREGISSKIGSFGANDKEVHGKLCSTFLFLFPKNCLCPKYSNLIKGICLERYIPSKVLEFPPFTSFSKLI